MVDITVVDGNKLIKYIETVNEGYSVEELLKIINSGQNRYNIDTVIDYLFNYTEKKLSRKTKISNNKLGRYLYVIISIFEHYTSKEQEIGEESISKIDELERLYINNRFATGVLGDSDTVDIFDKAREEIEKNKEAMLLLQESKQEEKTIEEKIDSLKPVEEQEERDEENLIAKLNARITDLQQELISQKIAFDSLAKQSFDDQKKISDLNKKIDENKINLKNARKEAKATIKELDAYKKESEKRIKNLEEYKDLALQREVELLNLSQKIESLENIILELETKNDELSLLNEKISITPTKTNIIDDYILNLLFEQKMSINEILEHLENDNFDVTKEEVLESLRRINQRINIMPVVGFEKKYGVVPPAIRLNQRLPMSHTATTYEFMIMADLHFNGEENASYVKSKIDAAYDYCQDNKIKIIYTLGDLIDNKNIISGPFKNMYDNARKVIEGFDQILPFDPKMKNFILGGNHDYSFARYGIDPVEELAFTRDDLISLGYNDAFMFFGGADIIGLHHEGAPRESRTSDCISFVEQTDNNLRRSYENARLNYSEKYFDFLGHFHSSRFNSNESFGIVPSLTVDRNNSGAWHVKIYLDNVGRIDYMIIKPLVFNKDNALKAAIEIPYQRKRK